MSKSSTDPSLKSRILYEDNHLIAVNKLPGELVQGDITGDEPLLEKLRNYIKVTYSKPGNVFLGLIHRLDRPTSGIVLFAKTSKALSRMNALFESRKVDKSYWALVENQPPQKEDRLIHYLAKNSAQNKSYVTQEGRRDAKRAVLNYKKLGASKRYFLLEIELETGRHHQIRAQLSAIGSPIKGDLKYGFARSNHDASIGLHAHKLSFNHPIKQEPVSITAIPPGSDKVWTFFSNLES